MQSAEPPYVEEGLFPSKGNQTNQANKEPIESTTRITTSTTYFRIAADLVDKKGTNSLNVSTNRRTCLRALSLVYASPPVNYSSPDLSTHTRLSFPTSEEATDPFKSYYYSLADALAYDSIVDYILTSLNCLALPSTLRYETSASVQRVPVGSFSFNIKS